MCTLPGANISHLWKRKIIFPANYLKRGYDSPLESIWYLHYTCLRATFVCLLEVLISIFLRSNPWRLPPSKSSSSFLAPAPQMLVSTLGVLRWMVISLNGTPWGYEGPRAHFGVPTRYAHSYLDFFWGGGRGGGANLNCLCEFDCIYIIAHQP